MRSEAAAMLGVFKYRTMTALAEAKGLDNRGLAAKVKANHITVSRWAKGEAVPSPSFINRLARVLEVPPAELYQVTETARDLRYYRVLAGYSLAQLAPNVGTSAVHLGRMEAGHSAIPEYVHGKLQEFLELDDETMSRAVRRSTKRQGKKSAVSAPSFELVRDDHRTELIGA